MPHTLIELLVKIAHYYDEWYPWLPPIDPLFDSMMARIQGWPYGTIEVAPWIDR